MPKDLSGTYLKNGPDQRLKVPNEESHWFDGDGMIHAFNFKDGKINYCNRWTKTEKYKMET